MRQHALGPLTRTVIALRRAGQLGPAVDNPRVYLLLLRAAVATDREQRLDPNTTWVAGPRTYPQTFHIPPGWAAQFGPAGPGA